MTLQELIDKILELGIQANTNRQIAINNGSDNLNSYYHGKLLAYQEILNYIKDKTK